MNTNTNTTLASRLRDACTSVRTKPYPLSDLIPLMQQAADALSAAAQPPADAWAIAESVRTDLDRQSCPGVYMDIAVESIVKHLAAAPKEVNEPVPDLSSAYQGAREDLAIWKRRALEAERSLRAEREASSRLVAEVNAANGPTHLGEPVQPERSDEDLALDLLCTVFEAYESGAACYEDPDELAGYIGNAVRMDNPTFHACAELLNRRRPIQPAHKEQPNGSATHM